MLSFVPVTFEIYRPLKPRLRWAMQCLVSFADHAGHCFPSIRTFAVHAGISKSAAGRDLAEARLITRKRRPGGVYVYQLPGGFCRDGRASRCPRPETAKLRHGTPDAPNRPREVSQSLEQKKNQIRKTKGTRMRA